MAKVTIKNRIIGLRYVKPQDLITSKKNWREHGPKQKEIMQQLLDSVGIVGAMLARPSKKHPGKYELFDGAMRTELLATQKEVPVLLANLSDKELDLVLGTYDKVAEFAGHDEDKFAALVRGLRSDYAELVSNFNVKELLAKKPEKRDLKPYKKLHILISVDVGKIETVQAIINGLVGMKGVQIEKSAN